MTNASALRREIEHALEHRFPAALTPAQKTIHETYATGIAAVDALLEGGLPVGAISEVTGPECSGRTSLALSLVAGRTHGGQVCAWVDAEDALDPESAAACGVSLRQLLWVRCRRVAGTGKVTAKARMGHVDQALRATDLLLAAGGFAASAAQRRRRCRSGCRSAARASGVSAMCLKKSQKRVIAEFHRRHRASPLDRRILSLFRAFLNRRPTSTPPRPRETANAPNRRTERRARQEQRSRRDWPRPARRAQGPRVRPRRPCGRRR